MTKTIFEEMGGTYVRQGDYLIPCLILPAEKEKRIGLFGRRYLGYLKEYHKITYTNLLTSGKLNSYLVDIDRQAQERFEMLNRADETDTEYHRTVKGRKCLRMGTEDE